MFFRYFITGSVQGVGFRAYIRRIATMHGLKGFVRNKGEGVEVVINHPDLLSILREPPFFARIDDCSKQQTIDANYKDFEILESE